MFILLYPIKQAANRGLPPLQSPDAFTGNRNSRCVLV